MIITRDVQEVVVVVDWTDDCRVQLSQRKARTKYTIAEARALRAHLDKAIGEASRAADGLIHTIVPLGADVDHIGPDCTAGKHLACDGRALDAVADEVVSCGCSCHTEAVAA